MERKDMAGRALGEQGQGVGGGPGGVAHEQQGAKNQEPDYLETMAHYLLGSWDGGLGYLLESP